MIQLARALDMRIIAEGVEDLPTLRDLTAAGRDIAQGYHIARPQPAPQLENWLASNDTTILA